ncbi:MAG: type II toxin-antitoxin system HicA family toxin [Jatrophihabitans sp.]
MGLSDLPIAGCRSHVKAFAHLGWIEHPKRGKGSHIVMTKPGHRSVLSIPAHNPVKRGTLGGLIKSAGITIEDYCRAFRE